MDALTSELSVEAKDRVAITRIFPDHVQGRAKEIAEIALVLIGTAYVIGFLVVFTFEGRLGIHDANAEFLRVRYIYTGLLCLAFPLFVVLPVSAHLWMYLRQRTYLSEYERKRSEGRSVGRSRLSYTIQILCVSSCLMAFVLFEPYGAFHDRLIPIGLLLGLAVIPIAAFPHQLGFAATVEHPFWRTLLAAGSAGLFFLSLRGSFLYLGSIVLKGSAYWIFVMALTLYIASSASRRPEILFPGQREGAQLARWAIIITLTILSILAFSYRLYPHIPADKGGGNYYFSRNATICINRDGSLPSAIQSLTDNACSVNLKILEITDTTIYAARTDDQGLDDQGQPPQGDVRSGPEIWSDGRYFPTVYAVSRSRVAYLRYKLQDR